MPLKAGELNRRVTIQRLVITTNETNEDVPGWIPVATVWAKFEPRTKGSGDEFAADQRSSRQIAFFTVRYRAGLDPTMRLVFDGEIYQIDAIGEPERRVFLELQTYVREVTTGP